METPTILLGDGAGALVDFWTQSFQAPGPGFLVSWITSRKASQLPARLLEKDFDGSSAPFRRRGEPQRRLFRVDPIGKVSHRTPVGDHTPAIADAKYGDRNRDSRMFHDTSMHEPEQ